MSAIAAVILCGGLGSRLGGVAKPLLRFGGEPILTGTMAALRPHATPLLLSIGAFAPERFADFGADALVPDLSGPSAGPLAGLFAAATHLRARGEAPGWLLSVAGDCPGLPECLPGKLREAVDPDIDVVFAGFAGQSYPPNALWRFPALARQMDALGGVPQGRGPRQLVSSARRRVVDFAEFASANPFEGLNDLSDLVRLARLHGAGL
jgi:molybdenum cofactor guanylyltransferase